MKPVICNYYLTYRCNARCGFCSIWRDTSIPKTKEATVPTVCNNLTDVKHAGVKIVDFTGGEPLLYDGLPEVLSFAKKIGLRTTVTTNGILYPDRADRIKGLVDILQFSLDSDTREGHDRVKGVSSFHNVMKSIEIARSLGECPLFIHTVTDENLSSVQDVILLSRSLDVPLFLNPCFSYNGNRGLSREGAIQLEKNAHGRGVIVDRGFLRFLIDGGNKVGSPLCRAVSSTVVISPDDRLLLPCFHNSIKALPVEAKLLELLSSQDVMKKRQNEGRYRFCEGCTIYCYMRASLFRKLNRYFFPSILSAVKYLYEYYRASRKIQGKFLKEDHT